MKIPNFRYSVQVRGPLQQHLKSAHLPQSEHRGGREWGPGLPPRATELQKILNPGSPPLPRAEL